MHLFLTFTFPCLNDNHANHSKGRHTEDIFRTHYQVNLVKTLIVISGAHPTTQHPANNIVQYCSMTSDVTRSRLPRCGCIQDAVHYVVK